MDSTGLTLARARTYIVIAALLWSTSGVFAKVIALPGPTMACLRGLFAAAVFLPLLRPRLITFHPAMIGMVACFTIMNVCFVTAMTVTTAANVIFLQYTAPAWMVIGCVVWLREPVDRNGLQSLAVAMVGVAVIVVGSWERASLGVALGLVAGVCYGAVAVFLRRLRDESAIWLTTLNHLAAGLILLPFLLSSPESGITRLTWSDVGALAVFGALQMGIPYLLFSRGLSTVSPQEAGLLALIEPVLNPILTWLRVGEVPSPSTLSGGAIILAAVAWRYVPRRMTAWRKWN